MDNNIFLTKLFDDAFGGTGFSFGRIIGWLFRDINNCGLDCDISEISTGSYILLFVLFLFVFYISRKILKLFRTKK